MATLKLTPFLLTTLKGPMYGDDNEGWNPPLLTKTREQFWSSLGRWIRGRLWAEVAVGCNLATSIRKSARADAL